MPAKQTPDLPGDPVAEETPEFAAGGLVGVPDADALALTEAANYQQAMTDHRPINEAPEE